jgi:hypothetical protein
MSRKDRRAAREDHARDLVSAITAPAPAAARSIAECCLKRDRAGAPACGNSCPRWQDYLATLPRSAQAERAPRAPMLGCFVRHTYRNGELVSE